MHNKKTFHQRRDFLDGLDKRNSNRIQLRAATAEDRQVKQSLHKLQEINPLYLSINQRSM